MSAIPPRIREAVWERDRGCCVRCSKVGTNIHHRRPRMMGGTSDPRVNDARNLIVLCGSGTTGCHGWIESHRATARRDGWLLASFDDLDRPMTMGNREIRLYPGVWD